MSDALNIKLFNAINQFAGQSGIVDKTATVLAEYLPLLFICWLIVLWLKKGKTDKDIVMWCIYTVIVALTLNFIITLFYFHSRPFMLGIGTALINHEPESSFPSDHTTFMASIALMLTYHKQARISGTILVFFAAIGGMSRVFCGIHFPFDIIGSFTIAFISCNIVMLLKTKLQPINNLIITVCEGATSKEDSNEQSLSNK